MQPHLQPIRLHQPQTFRYSLDWRFLLPMGDAGRIRVLSEENADFGLALEQVGIPVLDQLSFLDLKQQEGNRVQSWVLPFGLPVHWVDAKQQDQIEFYRSLLRLIQPGGYLVIGFNNAWYFRRGTPSRYHFSTLRRTTYQLGEAGFKSIKLFGAMPDLHIPEYIFHLESRAIHFVLHHRFRRKSGVLKALGVLAGTVGTARISNFLPCYFAVANS